MVQVKCDFCKKMLCVLNVSEVTPEDINHVIVLDCHIRYDRTRARGFNHICERCAEVSKQQGILAAMGITF